VAWFDGVAERFQSEVFEQSERATEVFKQIGRKCETSIIVRDGAVLLSHGPDQAKKDQLKAMVDHKMANIEKEGQ